MKQTLTAALSLLLPIAGLAAGIQVSPQKLEFELAGKTTKTAEMIVMNPTADVQLFEIYPDDFDRLIKISPASFTLEAGSRKKIQIIIDPDHLSTGIVSTTLSVLGKPLAETGIQINTGVKIPVSITASEKTQTDPRFLAGLIVVLIIVATGHYLRYQAIGRVK